MLSLLSTRPLAERGTYGRAFLQTPNLWQHDDVVRRFGVDRDKLVHARDRAVPMQRMGEAWDVAWAAVYLASDESRYVTGVLLPVDGGLTCKG